VLRYACSMLWSRLVAIDVSFQQNADGDPERDIDSISAYRHALPYRSYIHPVCQPHSSLNQPCLSHAVIMMRYIYLSFFVFLLLSYNILLVCSRFLRIVISYLEDTTPLILSNRSVIRKRKLFSTYILSEDGECPRDSRLNS